MREAQQSDNGEPRDTHPVRSVGRALSVVLSGLLLSLLLLNSNVLPIGAVAKGDLGGDRGHWIWNLWHGAESIAAGRDPYRADDTYYPLGTSLAKHTYALGFFPVTLAVRAWRGDDLYPIYAYRICTLLAFTLSWALMLAAARRLGADTIPAAAAATGYAFSAFFTQHIPHLNILGGAILLPAFALAVLWFLDSPTPRRGCAAAAVWAAGVYLSELALLGYLALLVAGVAALCSTRTRAATLGRLERLGRRGVLLTGLTFALVMSPFAKSWLEAGGHAPKARASHLWNANAAGFFVPDPSQTPVYGSGPLKELNRHVSRGIGGREVFLGYPLLIFGILGIAVTPPGRRGIIVSIGAVFLVLSLGPTLKVFGTNTGLPLPYLGLMELPPFNLARTPVRYACVVMWSGACLYAAGLTWAARAVARRAHVLAGIALALACLALSGAEGYVVGPETEGFTPPRALSRLPPGAVVNFPLRAFDGHAAFFQIFHHRPILTGCVARRSREQVAQIERIAELFDSDTGAFVTEMQRLGVGTAIMSPGAPRDLAQRLEGTPLEVLDLRRYP
jgi:hypothetical protein